LGNPFGLVVIENKSSAKYIQCILNNVNKLREKSFIIRYYVYERGYKMNIGQLLGIVNSIYHKATQSERVTTFTDADEHLLDQAIKQHKVIGTNKSLTEIVIVYLYILSQGNIEAVEKGKVAVSQSGIVPPSIRNNILHTTSKLVFKVPSVPGPARFCRVPFYPLRDEDSWTSRFLNIDTSTPSRQSFGIDEIGDDPILGVGPWLSTSDTTKAGPYTMVTRKVEFGAYRLVGLEIAAHNGARYIGAVDDGTAATGSVTITGSPAAATGTVEATGPTAVAAAGEVDVVGTGSSATGSVQFTGSPSQATGSIRVEDDGDRANVRLRLTGSEAAATAIIDLSNGANSGVNTIQFSPGAGASGLISFGFANLSSGDSVQLQNGDGTHGVSQVIELYRAGTEFAIGANIDATATNLQNAINANSTFSASYNTANNRMQITQNTGGTFGNNANGSNISASGFTPSITQFGGGTDAFQIGSVITVRDLSGNDRNLTAVDGGATPIAGQFATSGDTTTVANRVSVALIPLISPGGTLTIASVTNGIRLTFDPGYLPLTFISENSTVNSPTISGSLTPSTAGFDVMDTDTEIAISDVAGNTYTFAPQPAGTSVPSAPNRTAFTTTANSSSTATNLLNAINGSAGDFSATLVSKRITVTLDDIGRQGNNIALAYQTISGDPFAGLGPRPASTIFDQFDTAFSGGVSPVTGGEIFRLTATDDTVYTYIANNSAATSTTFPSNGGMDDTSTGIQDMLTAQGLFPFVVTTDNPPTEVVLTVSQTELGTAGNSKSVTSTTSSIQFSNDFGSSYSQTNTFVANGSDAVTSGQIVTLEPTDGGVATEIVFSTTPNSKQVQTSGLASDVASSLASIINSTTDFSAVVNGGDDQLVDITQNTAGSAGNTTIVENPVTNQLGSTNFTGGTDTYTIGDTITIVNTDGTSTAFTASATQGTGSSTDFQTGTQSLCATNLAERINNHSATFDVTATVSTNTVNLTQDETGSAGNTTITATTPADLTITNFTGGTDKVTPGTTVTVEDANGTSVVFTGVASGAGANQFNTSGSANDIALSLASSINGNAFFVTATASGSSVELDMDTVGTVGNGQTLTSSATGEISVTSAFSGGVDNVTDGTTITVIDSSGPPGGEVTFTARNTVVAATDFQIDNVDPSNTITNFVGAVNTNPFDVTGIGVGTTATLTQGTNGPDGNQTIATSDSDEFTVAGFTGGTYSVLLGTTITLTDTNGTTATIEAVDGATTATTFDVQPTISDTLDNLNTAIGLAGLDMTGTNSDPTLNLLQNVDGATGNTPIGIADAGGTVTAVSFTGGTNASLNLVSDLSPIALSIRELTVYNGDNILIVEDSESVPVESFNVLNRPETFQYDYRFGGVPIVPTGQPAATLSNFKNNSGYKFIGLRDQPIVDPNTQVFVKVEGFIADQPGYNGAYPADTPLPKIPPVSLSINLVVDLLEDKIFGDPAIPSPASRPGANIKLGVERRGQTRFILTNSTVKKPKL
jgi:hypothetical protein